MDGGEGDGLALIYEFSTTFLCSVTQYFGSFSFRFALFRFLSVSFRM